LAARDDTPLDGSILPNPLILSAVGCVRPTLSWPFAGAIWA